MTLHPELKSYAEQHARLLQEISQYDSAPTALKNTTSILKDIEPELAARENRLKDLIAKRKMEHKDFDNLQRSQLRRFFVRVAHGGKEGLAGRLDKEEREYIEAAQAEHIETLAVSELKQAVANSREEVATLKWKVEERKNLLRELDQLYRSAFTGPTPDFPEEDAVENALQEAEQYHALAQSEFHQEQKVLDLLTKAANSAADALRALSSASRNGTLDTWGVGGIWAEMAERDDLMRAQGLASQASRQLQQARSKQPLVGQVPGGQVVQPEWLNVVFDNIFTDMMFQEKIQQSIRSMNVFHQGLLRECREAEKRISPLRQAGRDAEEFMQARRRELTAVRREILTGVAEDARDAPPDYGTTGMPAPPTYQSPPPSANNSLGEPVWPKVNAPPTYNSPPIPEPHLPTTGSPSRTSPPLAVPPAQSYFPQNHPSEPENAWHPLRSNSPQPPHATSPSPSPVGGKPWNAFSGSVRYHPPPGAPQQAPFSPSSPSEQESHAEQSTTGGNSGQISQVFASNNPYRPSS